MTVKSPTNADEKFWNGAARKYAAGPVQDPEGFDRTIERVSAYLKTDDEVLELGCGTGSAALRIAPGVARYLATDISPEMIAIANEKAALQPLTQLSFEAATAEALARRPDRYDAVLGFNYIHLVEDIDRTLSHVHSMLKSDGYFISKTPCVGDMNPLVRLVIPVLRLFGKAPLHVHPVKASELGKITEAAGFEILAIEYHGTKGKDVRPFIVARKA